ncbi:DEAD/DEAH box helicase [Rhodococcus hoagii]|nr:DEAD/DEAH box helicase [Prescottella equi]
MDGDRSPGGRPTARARGAAHRLGQVGGLLHRREAAAGTRARPTVIVSPLLALMRNQVASAERAGVRAATINSGNVTEWDEIHERVAARELDVLLVSPERLNNPDFRDQVLPSLAADAGLVVVDEAHCVSDWGHDFRPDYRRIRTLVEELGEGIPVLATRRPPRTTASSPTSPRNSEWRRRDSGAAGHPRTRLAAHVGRPHSEATQRAAWLAEHLDELPGSGIIYTLTVSAARDLASLLADRGHQVAAYTGQTDAAERGCSRTTC